MTTVTIKETDAYTLYGDLYENTAQNESDVLGTLIYLHGGGLVFGERTDLPSEYIDVLRHKFNVLAADYRLAPESDIDDIFTDLQHIYHFAAALKHGPVYIMGRSAGGYLSLIAARDFDIAGVIDFYGYFNFTHSDFNYLPHDQKHLDVMLTEELAGRNIRDYVTVSESPDPRYLLYLYYRKAGNWQKMIGIDLEANNDKYRLTKEDMGGLPPVFAVHAKGDPDVPVFFSRKVTKSAPVAEFVEVDTAVHNFDQEVTAENISLYERAVEFMSKHAEQQT
ncbi:alpha/beta hydrolase fold protein [Jeotgalicoccus saudimassiliensis]|uniref:Alpha/beta hydrolase fold protein n=1 Tax=Jeotgalicoccus saudimassiliensis TaxID=1461582 RepID=A0A078M4X6_9STAP|nr:alpha/beta hydrolase [Jeotgalicoccus saudimassiliensis]CDZ99711.1 alpha/beta hydrolase fold protein [Jeotgalicoccus saudimassiliensis]